MKARDIGVAAALGAKPAELGEKTGASVTGEMAELLALTRAVYEVQHAAHWRCRGPNFAADHELFAKVYAATYDDIDGIAEKIIGALGAPEAVEPGKQSRRSAEIVAEMTKDSDLVAQALAGEKRLQAQYDKLMGMKLSQGLQNFVQGLADSHETSVYLLRQRAG